MKRSIGCLLLSSLLLFGCGSKDSESAGPTTSTGGKTVVEVAAFQGGYGIDFYEKAAQEYAAKHGVEVKVWGNPRVWEQLRPRFIGGNPPDLCFPGWGMDHWALVAEGQLEPLDKYLDGPAEEGGRTWRETFEPSILALGRQDGKQWILPFYFNLQGWWYDPGLFAKHGWTPPTTWDELLELCAKIKAKGIAPLTFQGKYPYYMVEAMLLPWIQSLGGKAAVDAIQNLEPGAWTQPEVLRAVQMIDELNKKGYFMEGSVALSHTESQSAFLNGKAAMIPCGTWLFSEMKDNMPKDAKLEYFLPPVVAGGKGDPTAIIIGIEPWMVPSAAKQKEHAVGIFKHMTSPTLAKRFVEEKGTLTAIKGSEQAKLPEVLVKPNQAFRSSKTVWSVEFKYWYPALYTEIQNALTAMLNGQSDPKGFTERCEKEAEKARADTSLVKHKVP
jgi:N-acetylglucosamine transport system substrate-binding protein